MKLHIRDVKPGMQLEQAINDSVKGICLLTAGTTLSIKNIEKIKENNIEYVEIADRYSVFISPSDRIAKILVKDFLTILREVCPLQPEANMNDKVAEIARHLESIIPIFAKNEKILNFLVEQKIVNNRFLYENSIHTAVYCGLVAGCMNLPLEEIVCCMSGALLHDIGLSEMPILIGADNLNGQQQQLYSEHPTYGYYFAVQNGISRKIAECILHHHERFDGSGYPKGLKGDEIPLTARIISVCADYVEQVICKGQSPYMALEALYGASGIYYDYDVVLAFVNNIPVYPLGELVRLSTKEVGIVSNIRKNEGPRPIVKVYFNRMNRPITEDKIIDLAVERTIFIEEIL